MDVLAKFLCTKLHGKLIVVVFSENTEHATMQTDWWLFIRPQELQFSFHDEKLVNYQCVLNRMGITSDRLAGELCGVRTGAIYLVLVNIGQS